MPRSPAQFSRAPLAEVWTACVRTDTKARPRCIPSDNSGPRAGSTSRTRRRRKVAAESAPHALLRGCIVNAGGGAESSACSGGLAASPARSRGGRGVPARHLIGADGVARLGRRRPCPRGLRPGHVRGPAGAVRRRRRVAGARSRPGSRLASRGARGVDLRRRGVGRRRPAPRDHLRRALEPESARGALRGAALARRPVRRGALHRAPGCPRHRGHAPARSARGAHLPPAARVGPPVRRGFCGHRARRGAGRRGHARRRQHPPCFAAVGPRRGRDACHAAQPPMPPARSEATRRSGCSRACSAIATAFSPARSRRAAARASSSCTWSRRASTCSART